MSRRPNALRRTGTTIPRVQEMYYEPGQTFVDHAFVVLNANGNVQECGANPVSITGVAMNGVATKPGYNVANDNLVAVRTGTEARVSVVLADAEQEFSARGVNGATDPVTPLQAHIGQQYGIKKLASGDWVIDFANQVNMCVQITDIFPLASVPFFAFKVLEAVRTVP